MSERHECCGDSDCSCAHCTPMRIAEPKQQKGMGRLLVEAWAGTTFIFALLMYVFWAVAGIWEVSDWLSQPLLGSQDFQNWTVIVTIYFLLLAIKLGLILKGG